MQNNPIFLNRNYLLFLLFCLTLSINAAPGDLDTTFSQNGKLTNTFTNFEFNTVLSNGDDESKAVKIQPDGKIVVAGNSDYGSSKVCSLARFNENGTLDLTFGDNGKVINSINKEFFCTSLGIQTDGKIVAAGFTRFYLPSGKSVINFAVLRFNANGSPDTNFGNNGKVITSISDKDYANTLVIQPDGKIIVAGQSINNTGQFRSKDFALVRYNADGSLDTTFDLDGKVTTLFPYFEASANAVLLQSDGKIVAAGYSKALKKDFALARYNADGSLDLSFGNEGKVVNSILEQDDEVNAVAIQADGKIVVSGYTLVDEYQNSDFALSRFNTDGSLDTSFGNNGKVITNIYVSPFNQLSSYDKSTGIVISDNGNILAAGTSSFGRGDFALACYRPDGTLDTTFEGGGKVLGGIWVNDNKLNALTIQNDGKLVAVGTSKMQYDYDISVARFNRNGSLDPSFDLDGKTFAGVGAVYSNANSVAIQADGKIVSVGLAGSPEYDTVLNYFAIARHNEDGSLDTTFDNDGKVITFICGKDSAKSVALQKDGKIVVAGVSECLSSYWNNKFVLVRYNSDGSLDTSFNGNGIVVTSIFGLNDYPNSVSIQDDGKIIVAGYSIRAGKSYFSIVRYNTDGSIDNSFGKNGIVTTQFFDSYDEAKALSIQPNGKIIVAGTSNHDFAVARFNADGSLDTTFDRDGKVTVHISEYDFTNAVALQNDGKIVIAGSTGNSFYNDLVLIRFNSDGSMDSLFGNQGIVTVTNEERKLEATAVAIQADGKIVTGGNKNTYPGDFSICRFNSDGSLDNSFQNSSNPLYGNGGRVNIDILDGSSDVLNSMVIDSLGRIVVAGNANGNFAVARILGDNALPSVYISPKRTFSKN